MLPITCEPRSDRQTAQLSGLQFVLMVSLMRRRLQSMNCMRRLSEVRFLTQAKQVESMLATLWLT